MTTDRQRVAEGHLAPHISRCVFGYLSFFPFQITEPEFCHRQHLRFERTANALALHAHLCE